MFWYPLSFVHEVGHCLSAQWNGGTVDGIAWHYGIFSQTLRHGSSHPVMDIWAGPMVGCAIPLLLWLIFSRTRIDFLLKWFAGMCLTANGVYIGLGWLDAGGDGGDLIQAGQSFGILVVFGVTASFSGAALLLANDSSAERLSERTKS